MISRTLTALIAVSVACTAGAGYFAIDLKLETAVAADSSLPLANTFSDLFAQWKSQSAASRESERPVDMPAPAVTPIAPGDGDQEIAGQIARVRGQAARGEQVARAPQARDEFAVLRRDLDLMAARYRAYQLVVREVGEISSGGRNSVGIHLSRLRASSAELDSQFEAMRRNVSALLTGSTQRLRQQQWIAVPAIAVFVAVATLASFLAFLVGSGSPRPRLLASAGVLRAREIHVPDALDSGEIDQATSEVDAAVSVVADVLLDGIIVYDRRGAIEFTNSAAETIFRLHPDGQIGRDLDDLIPELRRRLATPLASGETWPRTGRIADRGGRMMGRRTDGSNVPIQASVGAIVFGGERKFVCCVRDLSQQAESQRAAEALQEQIIQAQKRSTLSDLAGGIAHDFNNVLMPIIGLTELTVAKLPRGSKEAANLVKALTAANHARDLVRRILAFERQGEAEKQYLRLAEAVPDAIAFLRVVLPTTVRLEESIAAKTSPVLADPTQIQQILVNLGLNSFDAMAESVGVLKIGLTQVEIAEDSRATLGSLVAGHYLCLSVTDTGRGIDAQTIERIFEPFFTTKTVSRGAGLGLSVVASIVNSHDGAITVDSQPGQGTVFKVYLPALRGNSERQESAEWPKS